LSPVKPLHKEFVHPIEEEFARILDFYGIEWQYEPRTFDLEWDKDGKVTQAFTPDFFLPQQGLYVELTTLRPQLSTRKNHKLKLIRELYPDINIKLFKRREMHDLMVKYGLDQEAGAIQGSEAQKRPV
jgi:hypoxanthine phosphoribosyltransferase